MRPNQLYVIIQEGITTLNPTLRRGPAAETSWCGADNNLNTLQGASPFDMSQNGCHPFNMVKYNLYTTMSIHLGFFEDRQPHNKA